MALPNPSMDFTAFDTLTATELDNLVENDQALADGSGLDDSAVTTAKINDGAVTGTKISNLPILYQTDNSNTIASNTSDKNVTLQAGWFQVVGNNTDDISQVITFPTAFTTVLGVVISPIGAKSTSAAADITGFDTMTAFATTGQTEDITASGFTGHLIREDGTTFGNTAYYGASWMAWGIL